MKTKKLIYSLLFFFFAFTTVNAQNEDNKIAEVYGELNGSFFKENAELYKAFISLLKNRIHINEEMYSVNEKYEKISSKPLLNKYNKEIKHVPFNNKDDFNPLKYQLDFFSKQTKVYRIDDTNLIIVIDPQ